jgi:uncharacterized OB-fold protein
MTSPDHPSTRGLDGPLRLAAEKGNLMLQRCPACAFVPNFPRIACPSCLHELDWFQASGQGYVETYTVIRRTHHRDYEPHLPIVMALIRLDEGAETISTIVGDDRLEVKIGSTVQTTSGWSRLPQFRLTQP